MAQNNSQGSGGSKIAPFLKKTWEIVSDDSTNEVISWSSQGNSFVVWRPAEFARDILPAHFKHCNFSSFVRQLNTYGFRKVDPDRWEFANEAFRRDNRDLMTGIVRRKPAVTSGPSHAASQPHAPPAPQLQHHNRASGGDTTMTDAVGPSSGGYSNPGQAAMQPNGLGNVMPGLQAQQGPGGFPLLPLPYPLDLTSGLGGKPGDANMLAGLEYMSNQAAIQQLAMNAWSMQQQQQQGQMMGVEAMGLPQQPYHPVGPSQDGTEQGAAESGSDPNSKLIPSSNSAFVRPSARTAALLDAVAYAQGDSGSANGGQEQQGSGRAGSATGKGPSQGQAQADAAQAFAAAMAQVEAAQYSQLGVEGQQRFAHLMQAYLQQPGVQQPGMQLNGHLEQHLQPQQQQQQQHAQQRQQQLAMQITPGQSAADLQTAGSQSVHPATHDATAHVHDRHSAGQKQQHWPQHAHAHPMRELAAHAQPHHVAAAPAASSSLTSGSAEAPNPSSSAADDAAEGQLEDVSGSGSGPGIGNGQVDVSGSMDVEEINKHGKRSRHHLYAPQRLQQLQQLQHQQQQAGQLPVTSQQTGSGGGHRSGGSQYQSGSGGHVKPEAHHHSVDQQSGSAGPGDLGTSGGSGVMSRPQGNEPVRPQPRHHPHFTHTVSNDLLTEISSQLERLTALASEVQSLKQENLQLRDILGTPAQAPEQQQQQANEATRQSVDVLRQGQGLGPVSMSGAALQAAAAGSPALQRSAEGATTRGATSTSGGSGAVAGTVPEFSGGVVNMECSAGIPPQMAEALSAGAQLAPHASASHSISSGAVGQAAAVSGVSAGGGADSRSTAGPTDKADSGSAARAAGGLLATGVASGSNTSADRPTGQGSMPSDQHEQYWQLKLRNDDLELQMVAQQQHSQDQRDRTAALEAQLAQQLDNAADAAALVRGLQEALAQQYNSTTAADARSNDLQLQVATQRQRGQEQSQRTTALESQLAQQVRQTADAALLTRGLQEALAQQYSNAVAADARSASLEARLRAQEKENVSQRHFSAMLQAKIMALEQQLTGLSQALAGMDAARIVAGAAAAGRHSGSSTTSSGTAGTHSGARHLALLPHESAQGRPSEPTAGHALLSPSTSGQAAHTTAYGPANAAAPGSAGAGAGTRESKGHQQNKQEECEAMLS